MAAAADNIRAIVDAHPEVDSDTDDAYLDEKVKDAMALVVAMSPHLTEFPDDPDNDSDLERAAACFAIAMYLKTGLEGTTQASPKFAGVFTFAKDLDPSAVEIVKSKRGMFPPQS